MAVKKKDSSKSSKIKNKNNKDKSNRKKDQKEKKELPLREILKESTPSKNKNNTQDVAEVEAKLPRTPSK